MGLYPTCISLYVLDSISPSHYVYAHFRQEKRKEGEEEEEEKKRRGRRELRGFFTKATQDSINREEEVRTPMSSSSLFIVSFSICCGGLISVA